MHKETAMMETYDSTDTMLDEIQAPIAAELRETEREIKELVESNVPLIDDIVYHVTLYKGKRLRPTLVLLCGGVSGGITDDTIKAAAMVELLHTATLVHDDVIDQSDLRRGGPSVNSIWGNKASIMIGDLFFSRVLFRLAQIGEPEIIRMMSSAISRVCEGELLQIENGHARDAIDEEMYFGLIARKTASLLAVACELGAMSANRRGNGRDRAALRDFGETLGIAFQIKDDLMDYNGSAAAIGKPVASDLIGNTMTLPLLYGLRHADFKDRARIAAIVKRGIGEADLDEIRRFVRDSGGMAYAEKKAGEYTRTALSSLEDFEDSAFKRSLVTLAKFVTSRNY
jgi:octaprenyl-diphosphate synthase